MRIKSLEEDAAMRKLYKRSAGFTLVEMLLVMAIIAILATVTFLSVNTYISKANTVKSAVSANNSSFSSKNANINDSFVDLGY